MLSARTDELNRYASDLTKRLGAHRVIYIMSMFDRDGVTPIIAVGVLEVQSGNCICGYYQTSTVDGREELGQWFDEIVPNINSARH